MSFYKEVWQKLTDIDVTDKIEKKQNLSYLPWSWAWGALMEVYPESEYQFLDNTEHADTTVTVNVRVTIKDGDKCAVREMWLPVLNFKNQAMTTPDASAFNKTRMRCLTKCIAMFGLGHYIYAGEDLPSEKYDTVEPLTLSDEQIKEIESLIDKSDVDMGTIKDFYNLKSNEVAEIPVTKFLAVKNKLEATIKKNEAKNENN